MASEYVDFLPTFYGLDTFFGIPENEEDNATFASGTFYADFSMVKNKCDEAFKGGDEISALPRTF